MALPSMNISPSLANQGVVLQAPTIPGFSVGGGGTSSGSQFSGIDNPEALNILLKTLGELSQGGTPEMKRQQGERNKQIVSARSTLSDYTKANAFQDAADLIAQSLRVSMEKNMPAINRGIENAGTSGSAMAALLSQKLALESSQAAGALGAEQAKAYGGISSQLQGVLEALTRVDRGDTEALLKALDLFKTMRGSTQSNQNPTVSVGQGGGGSFYQPINPSAPAATPAQASAPVSAPASRGYWDYYTGNTHAADQPAGTNSFGVSNSNLSGLSEGAYLALLGSQPQNQPVGEQTWGYGD